LRYKLIKFYFSDYGKWGSVLLISYIGCYIGFKLQSKAKAEHERLEHEKYCKIFDEEEASEKRALEYVLRKHAEGQQPQ